MKQHNAAIVLLACSITGLAGDFFGYVDYIFEAGPENLEAQLWIRMLLLLFFDVALLLLALAWKNNDENRQSTTGLLLGISSVALSLYYIWDISEVFISGRYRVIGIDFYLWLLMLLLFLGAVALFGIVVARRRKVQFPMAGLLLAIGSGMWVAWLLYRQGLDIYYSGFPGAGDRFAKMIAIADFAIPVALFFFGLALHKSVSSADFRDTDVIDTL